MKIRIKHTALIFFLLFCIPVMNSCQSDDVVQIFTGKKWQLTYITGKDNNDIYDFWNGDATAKKASLAYVNKDNNFTVSFTGTATNNIIKGNMTGNVLNTSFSGTWLANGETSKFSSIITNSGDETDSLAVNFLKGLNSATSYKGDINNLYLYYKSGNRTLRMTFHTAN